MGEDQNLIARLRVEYVADGDATRRKTEAELCAERRQAADALEARQAHTPYREAGLDREAVAKLIHDVMRWAADNGCTDKHPEWQGGNSLAEDRARDTLREILALTSPTSEDAGEVARDEVCPLCEGRDMGPGGFCIAACREGKVRWTSANVLRNVKPWIEADQREIERLRAAVAGGTSDTIDTAPPQA